MATRNTAITGTNATMTTTTINQAAGPYMSPRINPLPHKPWAVSVTPPPETII